MSSAGKSCARVNIVAAGDLGARFLALVAQFDRIAPLLRGEFRFPPLDDGSPALHLKGHERLPKSPFPKRFPLGTWVDSASVHPANITY